MRAKAGSAHLSAISLMLASMLIAFAIPVVQPAAQARDGVRQAVPQRGSDASTATTTSTAPVGSDIACSVHTIAGMRVAVWKPAHNSGPAPLALFSHGFRGINTQSDRIMSALARSGYLVMAPNHDDSFASGKMAPVEIRFSKPSLWSNTTYRKRGDDITNLLAALKADEEWQDQIDMTRIALVGHSLGGYTMVALAGAWPEWKLQGVKAVVAMSPYCLPFLTSKTLSGLDVPVMYQGGTADFGISPFLKSEAGVYKNTPSPAYLVEFQDANHFTWTDLNRQKEREELIIHYCLAFLDKYVKGDADAHPEKKLPGVSLLEHK